MMLVPCLPENAPFNREQRAWLNGYLAGLFSRTPTPTVPAPQMPAPTPAGPVLPAVTVLFGSQTGTAEALAKRTVREATKRGFTATVLDMAKADPAKLAALDTVLVITSTYGEGEPPDNAKALHAGLAAQCQAATDTAGTPRPLVGRKFSVCGLGDTNYTHFCKCGIEFDLFFEQLGAARIAPRVDCNVEYETAYTTWLETALNALATNAVTTPSFPPPITPSGPRVSEPSVPGASSTGYSKQNPYSAPLVTSRLLSGTGSAKQVYHVEFNLEGSALAYEAGDALGVFPHNCPTLVADVVAALGCDGEEAVPTPNGSTTSLRHALTELYDLGKPSAELLSIMLPAVAGRPGASNDGPMPHHIIDLLLAAPDTKPDPIEFVRALRKLQPRLYSISSSPAAHGSAVHLTVGAVRYELQTRARKGVCSTFLADRVTPGESHVGVFIHANQAFRPPANSDTPAIMIGPGTGIAPFRGFLYERRARAGGSRNWLFFGDQRIATDYLYREEILAFQADGTLSRLDTAFSRDQAGKIYVQHRMLEHSAELYAWLQQGAHLYVCGDASRMAKDVDAAVHTIVQRAGGKSPDEAAEYVQALRTAGRYARDVY